MAAHRDTDLTSDIGRLRAKGGRKTWRRLSESASRSLPDAEGREHPIQDVVRRHHADQVVERPHRGAEMRGRGGRIHSAPPGGVKRVDFGERALQRATVAGPRHDRLYVT